MRHVAALLIWTLVAGCSSAPSGFLQSAAVAVPGLGVNNHDCRAAICKHNENTDLVAWHDAIWLVHRTAEGQALGPNSALHVYQLVDGKFVERARLDAPADRDIRDPHFFVVGGTLRIKALARLAIVSTRDSDTDTVALVSSSSDGKTWSDFSELGPHGWSFWRLKQSPSGEWFSAAYADGDKQVTLFRSSDGATFSRGADVYTVSADTPLETELVFMPSGKLLATVRVDGLDKELLGAEGRLRTILCWADPPYDSFSCPQTLDGHRLDGPLAFFWKSRLFMVARKHLGADGRKRTALFELSGDAAHGGALDGGPLAIKEWGELPSAGDTSYAGAATLDGKTFTLSWYAGDLVADDTWFLAMYAATDIWQARFDPALLK